ncbi:MAG TPA: transglycosylase SLT domain-containing protein [Ramlibacter sp.]|uniref:transglycosylase SLT domain-containing protein n=1 Tax=Ramlibacter sp. TaxID=1917967 RepID=UPI002D7FD577|nr:transglycosylase SLT domain-containing protein [Ramlibacter sp.]HET8747710.1 transglycosylase SLT domain-containing protein [Ramlibacter sp.]
MKTLPAKAIVAAAALGAVATLSFQVFHGPSAAAVKAPVAAAELAAPMQLAAAAVPAAEPAMRFATPEPKFGTEEALRAKIKFETSHWGGKPVRTLDEASRILLARAAAENAGLDEVGLGYQDVYGVIEAETSWIQRTGSSKDGTPNLGLAQFEPRTAKSLGLTDPQDPVQAVFAAAKYMKLGAQWASGRIGTLKSDPALYAAKLREGVSVHYNLSVKGRNKWNGLNTAQLPVETQRHIRNAAAGAKEAAELARHLTA